MSNKWEVADAVWLRNLLGQPSGQRLLFKMREMIPKVKAVTKESAWIQAVEKQGAENFYDAFLGLSDLAEPELREGEDYVDLTKEGD